MIKKQSIKLLNFYRIIDSFINKSVCENIFCNFLGYYFGISIKVPIFALAK